MGSIQCGLGIIRGELGWTDGQLVTHVDLGLANSFISHTLAKRAGGYLPYLFLGN